MAVDDKTSPGMYIQLHLLASHILTLKLMTCFHHLQVHGGKCSVTPHLLFRSLPILTLSPFTADQFTHYTQDQDHANSASPRILSHTVNASVDSSGSSSHWIDDVPITSSYKYHISDIRSEQTTQ
jgi:hypothetical protein